MAQYLKTKNTQGRQMCSDVPAYFTCRIFDSQAIARVSMIFSVGCFNYIKYVIPRFPSWRPFVWKHRADLQTRPDSGVPVFASVGFDRLCSIQIDPPFRNMIRFGAENVYQTCLALQLIPLDMLIKDAYICHFSAFLR